MVTGAEYSFTTTGFDTYKEDGHDVLDIVIIDDEAENNLPTKTQVADHKFYIAPTTGAAFGQPCIPSHAEGDHTKTNGDYSHAEGGYTITAKGATYQHVEGRYNVADATKALIIGNGTADNARSNALTVDWNGNVEVSGNLSVSGSVSGVTNDRYYAIKIDLGTSNISNAIEIPENALIENIAIVINTAYSDTAQTVTITQSNGSSSKTIVSALNIGNVPDMYNDLLYTQSIGGNISITTAGTSTTGSATIYLRVVDVVVSAN